MSERFVEVILRWGGDVVEVRRLVGDTKLTVGRMPSDDLFVPLEIVDNVELVAKTERGWELRTAPGMTGTIARGNDVIAVSPHGTRTLLDDDVEAKLAVGPFSLEVRRTDRSRIAALAPIFDVLWANTATLSLAAMAVFVAVFTLLPSPDTKDDDLITNPRPFTTLIARATPPLPPKSAAAAANAPARSAARTASTSARAHAPSKPGHKLDDAAVVDAKLAALFGGEHGLASLAGDGNLDKTASLIGGIHGTRVSAGLGVVGGGSCAACTGTVGIGNIASAHGRGSGELDYGSEHGAIGAHEDRELPVVEQASPFVIGGLDKEIIRRIVQEHVDQIRACYERELQTTPGFGGKVTARWMVGPTGRVSSSTATGTGSSVDGCIARHIRTWVFPAPRGGGDVVVSYPFVLKRAG